MESIIESLKQKPERMNLNIDLWIFLALNLQYGIQK